MRTVLGRLASQARMTLGDEFLDGVYRALLAQYAPDDVLLETLTRWAETDATPLVLLIDEIDMLIGDSLLAVLRQLRTGYHQRPRSFPQSVVLCGVRDVRDYRIHSGSVNAIIAGGSAFNVKAESLRLGDFSRDEVLALLGQHTAETGQAFAAEALELVWGQTLGQPWLVNALADDACFRDKAGRDRSRPIDAAALRAAQERLILRRETHLDQLADKLKEDRVRRVVEPLLSGAETRTFTDRDLEYIRDLGLLARDPGTIRARKVADMGEHHHGLGVRDPGFVHSRHAAHGASRGVPRGPCHRSRREGARPFPRTARRQNRRRACR